MKYRMLAGLMLLTGPSVSPALEVLGGISGRVEHSDNVLQVQTGEQSETMVAPRLDMTMVEQTGRVRGSGTFYIERADYLENITADETRYNLATAWTADILENRLQWVLEDAAGRRVVDTRAQDIGANRFDQNQLSTGPDMTFAANSRDTLTLSARYGNSWYGDDLSYDSERYSGLARLTHQVSQISSVGLRYQYGRTHYLDTGIYDFDRDEVALELDRQLSRTRISIAGGYNRVMPEAGTDYTGALGALSWHQQWRRSFYTELRGDWRLTDTGQEAITNALGGGVDIDLSVTSDVYEQHALTLNAGWDSRRWKADLSVRGEQQDYRNQPLDQDIFAVDAGASRQLNTQTTLDVSVEATNYKYLATDRIDNAIDTDIRINRVFSSLFYGAAGVSHSRRNSNLAGADFVENVVYLEFGLRGTLLARERGRELRHQGQVVY